MRRAHAEATLLHVGAIVLLTALAYAGSFDGQFVSDDTVSVRDRASIRALDLAHVRTIFTTFADANYLPVTILTFAVDYRFWGLDPTGYHLSNLVIHIGCALVVYALLLRLALPPIAAWLVALLWAVHPLQVESVAWISERKNVLSGLFLFAAFFTYLPFSTRPTPGRYAGVLLLYVLALLSKMNTMVLPALCLAHELGTRGRLRARDVAAVVPMLVLGTAVVWFNLAGNPIHGTEWHGGSRVVTWLSSAVAFFRYLGNILLPLDLRTFYDVPLRASLLDPPVLLSVAGLVALTGAMIALWQRRAPEAFWIAWYVVCLLPMLNVVVPFRALMHDRYMYLAMLGPLALGAHLALRLRRPALRRAAAIAAGAAALACAAITHRQVEVWHDPLSLWRDLVRRHALHATDPGVYVPEQLAEKVAFLEARLARDPVDAVAANNLGMLYFVAGRVAEALPLYERAARHATDRANVLTNLASAYTHVGRLEEAAVAARAAVAATPYAFPPRLALFRVHLLQGDVARARADLAAIRRIRPHASSAFGWRREQAYLERLEATRPPPGPS